MEQRRRIRILKSLAQAAGSDPASAGAPASAPGTTTTTTSTTPTGTTQTQSAPTPAQAKVDIRAVPGFRPQLFALRPDLINDLDHIANILNTSLMALSNNNVVFSMTWTQPSIESSAYANSLKHLFTISKWLYSVVKSQTPYYTMPGLQKIASDLIATINSYSFPEASIANVRSDMITIARTMLSKLGVAV